MQSLGAVLSATLFDRECRVTRREADWNFNFGEHLNFAVSVPWRIVTASGIALGGEDDGQWFGLPQPVDGEACANALLHGQKVLSVELDDLTADLSVVFNGGTRLDLFNNSSGFEGWHASVRKDGTALTVIALGGGGLYAH